MLLVADINKQLASSVGSFNKKIVFAGGAIGAGLAGVTSALVASGLALQFIPGAGTLVGAVLLGLAAAAAGMAIAFKAFGKDFEEERKKINSAMKLAQKASEGFARSTFRAQKSASDFDEALKQAKESGLNASQQLGVLAQGAGLLQNTFKDNSARLAKATKDRIESEKELVKAGVLSETGRETDNFSDGAAGEMEKDALGITKELRKQEAEARKSQNQLLKKLMAQESAIRTSMIGAIATTVNELNAQDIKGLSGFTGLDSIDKLAKAGGETGKRFKELQGSVKLARQSFKDIVNQRFDERIDAASAGPNDGLALALVAEKAAVLAQQEAELAKQTADLAVGINRARVAQMTESLVRMQQIKITNQNNAAMKAFNDMLYNSASALASNFSLIDDAISGLDFGAIQIDTSPLDQSFDQISRNLLAQTVGRAGMNTGGSNQFKAGDEISDRILMAKDAIDKLPQILSNFNKTVEDGRPPFKKGVGTTAGEIFAEFAKSMNMSVAALDIDPLGAIIRSKIIEAVGEAGKNPIGAEAIAEILAEIEESVDADIETIQKNIEIQNMFLDKMHQVNNAVVAAQQAYADATANVVDVFERSADRMAKATGKPRSSGDRERGRRLAANIRLGNARTDFKAQAGNVGATFNAAVNARGAARTARDNARAEANKVGGSPNVDGLDTLDKEALSAANGFKQAKKELERMANQSARAGDIMAEISEEQKKRGQLKSIGENLAFGSDDQRKDMAKGFMDLRTAIGQGGMQGANEDQRARISKTLDSLADVEVGGTGKTGREIKAQFQADEVMRLTGNKELAAASFDQAMKGSKEEQLLAELRDVGLQEAEAAAALAELASQEVNYLQKIAADTATSLKLTAQQAQQANPAVTDPNAAKREADLTAARDDAILRLDESTANQTVAQLKLTTATDNLADIMAVRAVTENPEGSGAELAGMSDEKRLQTADEFINGLKNKYAGQKATAEMVGTGPYAAKAVGDDILKIDGQGDITNLTKENQATYNNILGPKLSNQLNNRATQDGTGKMPARQAMLKEAKLKREAEEKAAKAAAATKSMGGLIYRAGGGSIFQPKGTDTVPAMLTPGEFVIKKSAVDQIGVGALASLNNGNAGAVYKADGGLVFPNPGTMIKAFYAGASDDRALKNALKDVYQDSQESDLDARTTDKTKKAGKSTGGKLYGAIKRLVASGAITPDDLGAPNVIEKGYNDLGKVINSSGYQVEVMEAKVDPTLLAFEKELSGKSGELNVTAVMKQLAMEVLSAKNSSRLAGSIEQLKTIPELTTDTPSVDFANRMIKASGMIGGDRDPVRFLDAERQNAGTLLGNRLRDAAKIESLAMNISENGIINGPLDIGPGPLAGIGLAKEQERAIGEEKKQEEKVVSKKVDGLGGRNKRDYQLLQSAGILRMAQGGGVGGGDTVPAMLTPGEYVMSNQAVAKYGVGYMKNLNRGRVPGFNKGGLVGRGNVQYRENGGSIGSGGGGVLGLDASSIQAVLDNFNASFSSSIDNMIQQFSTFSTSMTSLAGSIAQGMDVRLSITGDLTTAVSLDGDQADHVKRAIADAVVPELIEKVSSQIDQKFNELRNSP